jgi:hypothetical protein
MFMDSCKNVELFIADFIIVAHKSQLKYSRHVIRFTKKKNVYKTINENIFIDDIF